MRLDKYLKVSRLIKRRTVANEACDNGLVTVNGRPARASYDVKAGDQISLRFGQRTVTVEVLDVQETVRQADAGALYRDKEIKLKISCQAINNRASRPKCPTTKRSKRRKNISTETTWPLRSG